MPWRKDRPNAPGEMEFHLPWEKEAKETGHDETWMRKRAEKLEQKHKS